MNTVADKTHARLGPSGWDWWSNCPGAPALSEGLPNPASVYAAEGSVAHEVADRVLQGIKPPGHENEYPTAHHWLGESFQSDGFDFVVDTEMVEAVDDYVRICHEFIGPNGTILPEQQVPIGHLTGETGATGTSDCIGVSADGSRLIVIDLKYGKGVAVSAEGNGQGRLYALGALHKFKPVFEDISEVEIVIVQPRLDSVSSEILNLEQLAAFADEVEVAAGHVAFELEVVSNGGSADDLTLVPGEKQCRFCPAKGVCPALQAEVSKSLSLVAASGPEDFADLSPAKQAAAVSITPEVDVERLAAFMRAVPLIEEALKGVRAEVERRLLDGQEVPGFYLGVGRKGNRKWAAEDIEAQLVKRLGVGKAFEKKLISVATAEKLFKDKPRTWNKIKDLITQDEGRPSVCRDGDRNPPYALPSADDFADLSGPVDLLG